MKKIVLFGTGFPPLKQERVTKDLYGGKGYGLLNMSGKGLPVPEGVIIPTTYCQSVMDGLVTTETLSLQSLQLISSIEEKVGYMPLFSVRSGAKYSMPGMMDTILNVGLNDSTIEFWISKIGEVAALDSYRRLLQMTGEVIYQIPELFCNTLQGYLTAHGKGRFIDLPLSAMYQILADYETIFKGCSVESPSGQDLQKQLENCIGAVIKSWNNKRAIDYRALHGYTDAIGTAVTIQRMVFGNMDDDSCSGVLFTRDTTNGDNLITGDFLINAQGEDVVAGTVTPMPLHHMEEWNPTILDELCNMAAILEEDNADVQDIEFTVESGILYLLQTRTAKRTSLAAFKIAKDMVDEELISQQEAIMRLSKEQYKDLSRAKVVSNIKHDLLGTPASNGVVKGVVAFSSKRAVELAAKGNDVILFSKETIPDDLAGMIASKGIVTMTGGMTAHAAVVARGIGRTCVVGVGALEFKDTRYVTSDGTKIYESVTTMTVNGYTGEVWIDKEVGIAVEEDTIYTNAISGWYSDWIRSVTEAEDLQDGVCFSLVRCQTLHQVRQSLEAVQKVGHLMMDIRRPESFYLSEENALLQCFGVEPSGLSESKIVDVLLNEYPFLAGKVEVISSSKLSLALREKGFDVVEVIDDLKTIIGMTKGKYIVHTGMTDEHKSMLPSILQLISEAGREVYCLPAVMTSRRKMYEILT